tara:strand:+ start:112 stop:462 length:351 start_codon:yes stop_codon:yes gene_type:complete
MENFSFGSKPRMKEVPPGTEAIFSFNGEPEIVETEYGEKFSFPITLISHDSHPLLEDGPMNMTWESKAMCAKELYNEITNLKDLNKDYAKGLKAAYDNSNWQLTRFDTGAYWLDLA